MIPASDSRETISETRGDRKPIGEPVRRRRARDISSSQLGMWASHEERRVTPACDGSDAVVPGISTKLWCIGRSKYLMHRKTTVNSSENERSKRCNKIRIIKPMS